jgi:hypothetical protein
MPASPAPIVVDGSGLVEVGTTIVSVHRRPLTLASLDAFDAVTARINQPAWSSFGVYRLERVRPGDFADEEIRQRLVKMASMPGLQQGIAILDGPGLTNAAIRLALAGIVMLVPGRRSFDVVGSVHEGIATMARRGPIDGDAVRAAVDTLVARVWAA